MRALITGAITFLSILSRSLASPSPETHHLLNTVEDVLSETKDVPTNAGAKAGATNSEAISENDTQFNGLSVPPMRELDGDDFDKDTSKGYWLAIPPPVSSRALLFSVIIRLIGFSIGLLSIIRHIVTTVKPSRQHGKPSTNIIMYILLQRTLPLPLLTGNRPLRPWHHRLNQRMRKCP